MTDLKAGLIHPLKHRNIGQRFLSGMMIAQNQSVAKTWQTTMSLECEYDAVRLIFANNHTSPMAIGGCDVVSIPTLADVNANGATRTPVTFGGSPTASVPAADANTRVKYLLSDWINLRSTPRTDGGTKLLLTARALLTDAGVIGTFSPSDNLNSWGTRPDGRLIRLRVNNGDCITTPASFTSTSNSNLGAGVIGVQYMARGRVINVAAVGDSITMNNVGTYRLAGIGYEACCALNDLGLEAKFEYSNFGWSSSITSTFEARVTDYMIAFSGIDNVLDMMFMPNYSINDAAASPSQASVENGETRMLRSAARASQNGTVPIVWTGLPTNVSGYNIGAADQWRQAANSRLLTTYKNRGMEVADFAGAVSGATTGGQIEYLPGISSDGIHLLDAGQALIDAVARSSIRQVAQI